MSIKITNMVCEANCAYCYEAVGRDMPHKTERPLDIDAILAQMDREWQDRVRMNGGVPPTEGEPYLHGGEALLAGHETIEIILKKAYELAGRTSIQTYGYLIDEKYIEMFKKYKTSVGISIDGPWPLNKARPVPGRSTKEVTELVHRNILWMRAEGIPVSIITVLTKANAAPDKLDQLKEWLLWLRDIGVKGGRLNLAHMDLKQYGKALELSEEEAEHAWRTLAEFILLEEDGLYWQPFHDATSSLLGLEQGTCVFGKCPYFHATAEPVILSDGTTANCLKTAKTGNMYPRLEQPEFDYRAFGGVRYEVLQAIPFELGAKGGCGGCKYWRNCMGGCPSEGIGGDWRNKTRFCRAYYALFETADKALKRILPSIITTADAPDTAFPDDGVVGMNPPAFARMDWRYTNSPSAWRKPMLKPEALPQMAPTSRGGGRNGGNGGNQFEHFDGPVRHLDSNIGGPPRVINTAIEHLDGDIFHVDSGPVEPEDEDYTIRERLDESNNKLKNMRKGRK